VTSWELDDAENFSGSDTSGLSLSDYAQKDEPGNTSKILKSLLGKGLNSDCLLCQGKSSKEDK
jgi:hypothetical protein